MLQRRSGLNLHHEPLCTQHGGELGLQHLERDVAIMLEIVREIYRRHAAGAELALDLVAAGEGGVEAVDGAHRGFSTGVSLARRRASATNTRDIPPPPSSRSSV